MSFLPNIEPTSLLVMVYVVVFGRKALYPIYLYVALEILFYGIQLWNINYLYIWLVPVLLGIAFRKETHPLFWAVVSGAFGLFFGLLCAPVYLFIGGPGYAIGWWVAGFPFDLLHCGGNFVIALVLFVPLRKLLTRLYSRI
jgi:energy-coupling factor transport system substrate-specific component